ncbi:hypothetical protein DPMN_011534 [Dreissena polymorpha]|uniref:Uncharacterized protein n=1 Tax=Dreissena polymorpha TaxID=45954 RepID=A0A9D4N6B5_DREPO|nr:hypothetical protein DPMN_011534 [Dreissena polymorpha]
MCAGLNEYSQDNVCLDGQPQCVPGLMNTLTRWPAPMCAGFNEYSQDNVCLDGQPQCVPGLMNTLKTMSA